MCHVYVLSHVWLFCNPMDYSLPGSSVCGIFQARILEQIAISFSKGSSQPRDRTHVSYASCISRQILYHWVTWKIIHQCVQSHFSCVWLCMTLWTVACQAPLSKRFSRQEYWSGLPFPSPGDLPDPESQLTSVESAALTGGFFTTRATWSTLNLNGLNKSVKRPWQNRLKNVIQLYIVYKKLTSNITTCTGWK